MGKKQHIIGGKRKVIRIGGSLAITLPPEFTEMHGIKEGDSLGFLANHILKLDPMKEGEFEEEEEVVSKK